MASDEDRGEVQQVNEAEDWKLKALASNQEAPPMLTRCSITSSPDDQSLLQIYEALSMNLFRFVLTNVDPFEQAL